MKLYQVDWKLVLDHVRVERVLLLLVDVLTVQLVIIQQLVVDVEIRHQVVIQQLVVVN